MQMRNEHNSDGWFVGGEVSYKKRMVIRAKCNELGLNQLSKSEEAQIQIEAEKTIHKVLQSIVEDNEDYQKLSDDEKNRKANAELFSIGYTIESAREDARDSLLSQKLKNIVTKDINVSDEEIKEDYYRKVAQSKKRFESNEYQWCKGAENGLTMYYTPPGIHWIKRMTIWFMDSEREILEEARSAEKRANYMVSRQSFRVECLNAELASYGKKHDSKVIRADDSIVNRAMTVRELNKAKKELSCATRRLNGAKKISMFIRKAANEKIEKCADDLITVLKSGADLDSYMAKQKFAFSIREEVVTRQEWLKSLSLEKVGDVSRKIEVEVYDRPYGGIEVIQYLADANEGPIPFEQVKDEIRLSLLTAKQYELYNAMLQSWMDAASYYAKFDPGKEHPQ